MSAPETPELAAPREGMFAAYREVEHRSIWPWLLLVAALVAVVLIAVRSTRQTYFAVETKHGVQRLSTGMGASQVERYLGHPIAIETQDGLECRRYGHLTFEQKFWVYSVCYDGGHLVNVKAGQFEAKRITNIPRLEPSAGAPSSPSPASPR